VILRIAFKEFKILALFAQLRDFCDNLLLNKKYLFRDIFCMGGFVPARRSFNVGWGQD
jgi:hypothetical protein